MTGKRETQAYVRFDACLRAHYADIVAYALRRLDDRRAADDVAAETFAVAWRRVDSIPPEPLPWLLGVARHVRAAGAAEHRGGLVAAEALPGGQP